MAKKIWNLLYVVGNPAIFSRVTSCAENPMARSEAFKAAEKVAGNGGNWRVWVARGDTIARIFESDAEKAFRAAQAAGGLA